MDDTQKFEIQNQMVMNCKKTKTIVFNKTRKLNFPPEVLLENNKTIANVNEIKLVGVIISRDL